LDIESVIYIWKKLKERCKSGTSILFISSDLEEILQYSDRVIVFFSGKVSEPLDASTTTVEQLGQLIGGKGWTS
jgi:simple sugar transport system ATP-binding protein